jgi:hypothetical protein
MPMRYGAAPLASTTARGSKTQDGLPSDPHVGSTLRKGNEQVDLMAGFLQPGERFDANPCVKALRQRVAIEVENPHGRAGP